MSRFLEIIELSNGDIALRHVDEESGDALVSIRFSDDAKASLQEHCVDVARAMLEAGALKVSELSGIEFEQSPFDVSVGSERQVH